MPTLPLPAVAPAIRRRRALNFLVWHDIVPNGKKQVWFDTTTGEFATQLARLQRAGARPVLLADAANYLRTGTPLLPPKSVVLCFDDNTSGIHDFAFPLLRRRGWPFVVSAHTEYVGVRTGKNHCTWAQLRAMRDRGRVTIVSQTATHPPDLRTLNDTVLRREFEQSRDAMRQNLGQVGVPYLTYPAGRWDAHVAAAAQAAGYLWAFTEDFGAAEASPHLLAVNRWSTHRRFDQAVRAIAASR